MSYPVTTGGVAAPSPEQGRTATIIYILYLVGFLNGITVIIGLIMAYVNLEGAPEWVQTHYRMQIRTFWIGLLIGILGFVTLVILVGWLISLFNVIWFIVRCVKGMMYLSKVQPYPNPTTWLW